MATAHGAAKKRPRFNFLRVLVVVILIKSVLATGVLLVLLATKESVFDEVSERGEPETSAAVVPLPFPVSVDPQSKTITENPSVNTFLSSYLAYETVKPVRTSWWHQLTRKLASRDWYQNLASPVSRILIIWPGDRKEEVVDNFGDILRWDEHERATFATIVTEYPPTLPDGTFFPGRYVTSLDATPETVASLLIDRFTTEVQARYPASIEEVIPLKDALIVASLLEREAYAFDQMREISGVIWNRLFAGMPLQLDATLQYVKASDPSETAWWPTVTPADKFIESPFNTYENAGLPPSPIANPSAAAILAALNPYSTDCMFYFHDEAGDMHCSVSYDEHVAKLRTLYGRGQ